ncbi:MAG TPA: BON domain-containing protein [Candidatus Binatia bacterium]|jgi:hyperosmotically inducible protein
MKSLALVVLVLSLAGCQSMTGKTAGQNVDDANLTASVKAKLVADKAANLTRIDVDTNGGIVYLNGTVSSPQEKAKAEQLARETSGVKKVVNNLQIAQRSS